MSVSAAQQIADWLEKLALGQYTQCFAENEIDFSILGDLTDQDLEKIGVAPLGHRRKLLRAIAELSSVEKGTPAVTAEGASLVAPQPRDAAERRQVTVMFSDLVGSTALSARMDPEDLREVISAYQKCVAETVQRFGGFVAKYMGDGVLVYFGYPQAHEHDAERAVRAGLELVQAVGGMQSGVSLQTRVGIATGLVVVGDLIGTGSAQEQPVVGETPNLAARLQALAEPNTVVIAESTRMLLGNLFDLQDLGGQDLKGIAGPVRAWAALRPASIESRFDALHASGVTELVGREEELELLLRRWSKAKTGEGQVVLLSGEAGIGKSRLTAALLENFAGQPPTRLRYFCSPQHTDSALYPVIGQMERAAGFMHDDTPQAKLDKLEAVLAQTSTSKQDAALFAEMLSLPNDGRYPARELEPQQRRQKTLEALTAQVEELSRQSPLLMIFEDAHWTDPTSLETLSRIVDRLRAFRVLLIVTFRPEFDPLWIGRPYVTALTVNRLAQRDIETMIDGVVGNNLVPASIRQDIIERTDGIPLFVEEMTKAVLEAGSEGAAQQTVAAIPSPTLTVPASLHASLMARLDRLGPAKEAAQIGAAIGREFSHALLAAVARKPEAELASALDRLIAAGLLFRQGVPPYATYLFKHALVQDSAYGMLLREPRRVLHAQIAETLESQFAEIAENQPELLARHYTEAGLIEKAANLWGKAGQRSLERSALVEAIEQFNWSLSQIAALPATPALRHQQIKFQIALITPLVHVKGYAAPETKAAIEQAHLLIKQAEALEEHPDDPLLSYTVLYAFWAINFVAFNGDVMRELATQFLALAEKQGSNALSLIGPRFGQDIGVPALCFRSLALWVLGYPDAALLDSELARSNARAIGQAATLMYSLSLAPFIQLARGNYIGADETANELVALAGETGTVFWKARGMLEQGCTFAVTGKAVDAIRLITLGLDEWRSTGTKLQIPWYLVNLTRAFADPAICQFDEALRSINDAMTASKTSGEKWCEAEVNRIAGEIALLSREPDAGKAHAYFERALAVARAQQAKSWELRAAMSMARLWRDQGKRDEARELLAPVYGWFSASCRPERSRDIGNTGLAQEPRHGRVRAVLG